MFFDFLFAAPYEERKVDRYEDGDMIIDTCAVNDSDQPYETAISHASYNDGNWVIVELYDTPEEAQSGHDRWVKRMTAPNLPRVLENVSTSGPVKFAKMLGVDLTGPKEWGG